jgi:hypothetical protein
MFYLRFVCLAFLCLLSPLPALGQACPANPTPPLNLIETSETKQNINLCPGQTFSYDLIEDVPVFVGACFVAINRNITHVTEVSAGTCTVEIDIDRVSTTHTSSSSETKQNPNLCQGETRTYDVVLTQIEVVPILTYVGNIVVRITFVTGTITHTLHVTEVGTKVCVTCLPNPPVTVIGETNLTRESPNLCQGDSRTFDEFQDTPIWEDNCVIETRRTIVHVKEMGTRDCVNDPFPTNCQRTCFASADRLALLLRQGTVRLDVGTVWYLGTSTTTNNRAVLLMMLNQFAAPRLRFGREHLAIQLSLLRVPWWERERIKDGALECQGVVFAPVTLSNGVTLTKKSSLRTLLDEAQSLSTLGSALDESEDAAAVLEIMQLLNRCVY